MNENNIQNLFKLDDNTIKRYKTIIDRMRIDEDKWIHVFNDPTKTEVEERICTLLEKFTKQKMDGKMKSLDGCIINLHMAPYDANRYLDELEMLLEEVGWKKSNS